MARPPGGLFFWAWRARGWGGGAFAPASRSIIAALSCASMQSRGRRSLVAPSAARAVITCTKLWMFGRVASVTSWTTQADISIAQFQDMFACSICAGALAQNLDLSFRCPRRRASALLAIIRSPLRSAFSKEILFPILAQSTPI